MARRPRTALPAAQKRPPRSKGRPTGLTPELAATLIAEVQEHFHLARAARVCGIKPSTLSEWVRRGEGLMEGRPATEQYAAFAAAIKKAQAGNSVAAIGELRRAGKGGELLRETVSETVNEKTGKVTGRETVRQYTAPNWQANAWWLERTDRVDLARPVTEKKVEGAVTVTADTERLLRAVVKVLHKYLGPRAKEALVDLHQTASGTFAPIEGKDPPHDSR